MNNTIEVYHGDHGPDPKFEGDCWTMYYRCSKCHKPVSPGTASCDNCGQELDWSSIDEH